ncbi:hypothetical protein LOTGIDRAFT_123756, partial [Lottia gigantea]
QSKGDYLVVAASQIGLAQECESNGNYEMAFAYYKIGVDVLIQGVQGDTDRYRQDAVRRKTAQYLLRAEEIYNNNLSKEILGTIDNVILVMDKLSDETFVIKTVHKSSAVLDQKTCLLPTSSPYMCNLLKFFETENAVYLLLQYASGGKLWNYIGAYLHGRTNSGFDDGLVGGDGTETKNVYTGHQLTTETITDIGTSDVKTTEDIKPKTKSNTSTSEHIPSIPEEIPSLDDITSAVVSPSSDDVFDCDQQADDQDANDIIRSSKALIQSVDKVLSDSDRVFNKEVKSKRLSGNNCVEPEQVKLLESCIRQWASEIVVAVSKLHHVGIICRDLNPNNILLGDNGHIMLTYFSRLPQVDEVINQEAAEELYVAPEVLSVNGFDETCDWWSLGALLYELLVGQTLLMCHPGGINSHTNLYIPSHVSQEGQGLLQELLRFNPKERLGSSIDGVEAIKSHPFFNGIDWNAIEGS